MLIVSHWWEYGVINCFSWIRGYLCFKRNVAEFSSKILMYFIFWTLGNELSSKRVRISYALWVLGWSLGNRDLFKGMRRLSRIDFSGSGRDKRKMMVLVLTFMPSQQSVKPLVVLEKDKYEASSSHPTKEEHSKLRVIRADTFWFYMLYFCQIDHFRISHLS